MSNHGNYKASPEFIQAVKEKRLAMANVIIDAALNTVNLVKQFPKYGKRNPFKKYYNRRPRNKQKRALLMAQLAINAKMADVQLNIIASQPIPKYSHGISNN